MKRARLRILIVLGILILVGVTGIAAETAGPLSFFINLPIAALIVVLVSLLRKK